MKHETAKRYDEREAGWAGSLRSIAFIPRLVTWDVYMAMTALSLMRMSLRASQRHLAVKDSATRLRFEPQNIELRG